MVFLSFQWEKVSPIVLSGLSSLEKVITAKRISAPAPVVDMSEEEINKTVKFVEASTRKKPKPKKI